VPGELRGDRVYVRDQPEANRIYNKGGYGKPLSGGALELDLVEAAYLLGAGRLSMEEPVSRPEEFLSEAAKVRPTFGVQFLAYRELREQRPDLRLAAGSLRADGVDFRVAPSAKSGAVLVRALSERSPIPVSELYRFAERAAKEKGRGLLAVVDEESEVTQYEVAPWDARGTREPVQEDGAVEAFLLHDRLFLPSSPNADRLHEREFFGKKTPGGFLLSLVEAIHLAGRGLVRVMDRAQGRRLKPEELRKLAKSLEPGLDFRHPVYEDLKARRLIVKTGYKFGTHFRAYEEDPRASHAPYLVDAVKPDATFEWPQLSRAIRLSHGVRKKLLLAEVAVKKIRYLSLERIR
jgi:tRNA-intron endonuclease, archaea type